MRFDSFGATTTGSFENNGMRMAALKALARAADAPTDTPPGGGLPCPVAAPDAPVAESTPMAGVAVSGYDEREALGDDGQYRYQFQANTDGGQTVGNQMRVQQNEDGSWSQYLSVNGAPEKLFRVRETLNEVLPSNEAVAKGWAIPVKSFSDDRAVKHGQTSDAPVAQSAPGTGVAVSSAEDQLIQIGHKIIKGYNVSWMNNGMVYIGRELFDLLAVDSEFIDWTAKTPGEFEAICDLIAKPSACDAPRHPRNIVPDNGRHIVNDAFEAWTFTSGARFAFVMYIGRQFKPYAYYGYATEEKRDAGFEKHAQQARDILASKVQRKADSKAQADKPHGLQVGDVVRSSWGCDQTNINHYQITEVIGKRTVEVRELAGIVERERDMSGDVAPVWGEFKGEAMRRSVDKWGRVNILGQDFGRASKIEPLAVVHGVRCYAASGYSTYA